MRAEEGVVKRLLGEILAICTEQGSTCYLLGDDLLYSELQQRKYTPLADICMTWVDFCRIKSVLNEQEERIVEDVYTNPLMPGAYYRYVDTTTFMLEPEYHRVRKEHGVAVTIHILRMDAPVSEQLFAIEDVMEAGIEGCEHDHASGLEYELYSRRNTSGFGAWVERLLEESSLKDLSCKSALKIPGKGILHFPENYWSETKMITVEGMQFTVPEKADVYLKQCYGKTYETGTLSHRGVMFQTIADARFSYRDIADKLFEDPVWKDRIFWEERRTLLDNYFNDYVFQKDREDEIFECLFITESRILLWKRYYWQKEKLKKLYEEERFDELDIVFSDMTKHIKRHLSYGYVPYFEKEIWDLYIAVRKQQGDDQFIETVEQCLAEHPFEELTEKLLPYFEKPSSEMIRIREIASDPEKRR